MFKRDRSRPLLPAQKLTLVVSEEGPDMVKGTYSSLNPYDQGTFQLQKGVPAVARSCKIRQVIPQE